MNICIFLKLHLYIYNIHLFIYNNTLNHILPWNWLHRIRIRTNLFFYIFLDRRNKMDKHGCLLLYLIMIDIRRFYNNMIGSRKHKDHAICQDLFNNTFIICKLIKSRRKNVFGKLRLLSEITILAQRFIVFVIFR